jgi:hypothetical protein
MDFVAVNWIWKNGAVMLLMISSFYFAIAPFRKAQLMVKNVLLAFQETSLFYGNIFKRISI